MRYNTNRKNNSNHCVFKRFLIRNNNAVSTVVAYLITTLIIVASVSIIYVWGGPFVEERQRKYELKNCYSECNILNNVVETVVLEGAGSVQTDNFENPNDKGSIYIDEEGSRLIMYYSYNSTMLNFSVSGLDDDNRDFDITVDRGKIDDMTIYWLNDTCFVAGTRVLMADGSYKNIEDIVVGDWVKSYDEELGVLCDSQVSCVHHHSADEMFDFYLLLNDYLGVTVNHRFYTEVGWRMAGNLGVGESLFTSDLGFDYSVDSFERVYSRVPTFDLSVNGCHNFFVDIGDEDVLVHNQDLPPLETSNFTINTPTPSYIYTGYPYNITLRNVSAGVSFSNIDYVQVQWNWSGKSIENGLITWDLINTPEWTACSFEENTNNGKINITLPAFWQKNSGDYKFSAKVKIFNNIVPSHEETPWSDYKNYTVNYGAGIPTYYLYRNSTLTNDFTIPNPPATNPSKPPQTYSINNLPAISPPLQGAVRIDLYNSSTSYYFLNGTLPVGKIWIFDLGSINYILPYSDGTYEIIMQNGGTVAIGPESTRILDNMGFYETTNSLAVRLINFRAKEGRSSRGSGSGSYQFRFETQYSLLYDLRKSGVYNFTIQFYGEHYDIWLKDLLNRYDFLKIDSHTIRYSKDGIRFLFTQALVKTNIQRIRSSSGIVDTG